MSQRGVAKGVLLVFFLSLLGKASASQLYIASGVTDSVIRYDGNTGAFIDAFVPSGSGGLDSPRGVIFGPDGNLYVSAGASTNAILRYDGSTGAFIDVFAASGNLGAAINPFGIVFGSDGNLYATDFNTDSILRFNGATGTFIDTFASGGGLDGARGLVFGPDGHLYVASADSDNVLRYNGLTGAFMDVFADNVDSRGLTFGPDGNLYVADFSAGEVERYDGTNGMLIDTFASGIDGPVGVAFGSDGNLYADGFLGDDMLRFDGGSGALIGEFISAGSGGLEEPRFFVFGPAEDVPEPETIALLVLGLAFIGLAKRQARQSCRPSVDVSRGKGDRTMCRTIFFRTLATVVLSIVTLTSPVHASVVLYGVVSGFGTGDGSGGGAGTGPGSASQLHRVDINTGHTVEISSAIGEGSGSVSGLAASADGTLYSVGGGRRSGILRDNGTCCRVDSVSNLFTISPTTGMFDSIIGPTDIENRGGDPVSGLPLGEFAQVGNQRQNVSDMAMNSAGELFGVVARGSQLGQFDLTTGFATKIGDIVTGSLSGNSGEGGRGNALAFDAADNLWFADDLMVTQINVATGAIVVATSRLIDYGVFGAVPAGETGYRIVGMDFHPLTGELFTTVQQGAEREMPMSYLAVLDPTSGNFSRIIGPTGVKLEGIAFVDVPEPTTFVLLVLGLSALGFARRRLQ